MSKKSPKTTKFLMKMDNNICIAKYNIRGKFYYGKFDWKENEHDLFHIKLYDGNYCWTGRFSNEFAEIFRNEVDETVEQYRESVKDCLSQSNKMFVYDFVPLPDNPTSATFSWKKKFDGEVLLVHGSVPVHQDQSKENKDSLIDILLQENKDLKLQLQAYDMNIHMLSTELQQSRTELEKFMNMKTSLEMSVYGKFVQLLNTKKRRIQLLEQNLQELQSCTQDNELD
ncbi:uncharacterized protein LOC126375219 [Pectinophora gossypiella]|uniref:XRCC4 N-terminal domain-containing protein n=1 Tax=Pectinophora gossypiella TaxID=13191 RepID=A0A1E1WA58_PECGO|nr:uncharacterized protein LOC126375219 [Pectinophora gossypiella]